MLFKTIALLFAAVAVIATGNNNGCNGNNCDRAVAGTAKGLQALATHKAECYDNLKCTKTPAATYTKTVTEYKYGRGYCETKTIPAVPIPEKTTCNNVIRSDADVKDKCETFQKYKEACEECLTIKGSTTTLYAPIATATLIKTGKNCNKW